MAAICVGCSGRSPQIGVIRRGRERREDQARSAVAELEEVGEGGLHEGRGIAGRAGSPDWLDEVVDGMPLADRPRWRDGRGDPGCRIPAGVVGDDGRVRAGWVHASSPAARRSWCRSRVVDQAEEDLLVDDEVEVQEARRRGRASPSRCSARRPRGRCSRTSCWGPRGIPSACTSRSSPPRSSGTPRPGRGTPPGRTRWRNTGRSRSRCY